MEKREYMVYKFEELSEEGKQKAIEKWREDGLDYDWWDSVYEDAAEIADRMGIDLKTKPVKLMNGSTRLDPCIWFSGFSSQGDGACFEGTYRYKKGSVKAVKKYAPEDKELHRIVTGLYEIQKKHFYKVYASIKHSGHYYHSGCTDIGVDLTDGEAVDSNTYEPVRQLLRDFMDWIYKHLEEEYEFLSSDEAIKETLIANEYDFRENGEID